MKSLVKLILFIRSLITAICIFYFRPSLSRDVKQEKSSVLVNLTGISHNNSIGSTVSTSFQDFQESVDDAWELGDDEFCLVPEIKISKKVSHTAALSVINHHRNKNANIKELKNNVEKTNSKEMIHKEKKKEIFQRLSVQPFGINKASLKEEAKCNLYKSKKDFENKSDISSSHSQFPGRPQPWRQPLSSTKFFLPFKEQGDSMFSV